VVADDLGWSTVPVLLPVAAHLEEKRLLAVLENYSAPVRDRVVAANELVWLRWCRANDAIDVSCLRLKRARVSHLHFELFVEYELAAQQLRPELFVAMSAYGDHASGYIGTEVAYSQGGYETRAKASLLALSVERGLMDAFKRLLQDPQR